MLCVQLTCHIYCMFKYHVVIHVFQLFLLLFLIPPAGPLPCVLLQPDWWRRILAARPPTAFNYEPRHSGAFEGPYGRVQHSPGSADFIGHTLHA